MAIIIIKDDDLDFMFLKNVIKNRTVKNAGWLIAEKVIQMAISLFVGLLTARYLGPSNYGLINYAAAYTAFFSSFCTLGINSLLVKEFVDHPEKEGEIIGTTLLLRGISSIFSAITIIGIVSIVDMGEKTTILVVALCSLGLVFHIFDTFSFWFQRHLNSKVSAFATLIAYIIISVYKMFLVVTGKDVFYFALSSSIDYVCIAIILFIAYRRYGGKKLSFSWEYGKSLLSKSHHFILSGLMGSIYGQTDKLMLKQLLDTSEVGYYSTAIHLCNMWCFILAAIINSMYPSIMEAHNTNEEKFEKLNRQLYAIVFYVSIFVSLCFCLFGGLAIKILYGKSFLPAVAPLKIITWYTAFSYLGVARNAWLVCKNKQKYIVKTYFFAAIINVALNFVFIPLMGASGAALASLITQIFTGILLPLLIKELRENAILMLKAISLKDVFPKK